MLVKVQGKDTASVVSAVSKQICKLPSELRRSLTWNRGMEMAHHKNLPFQQTCGFTFAIHKDLGNAGRMKTRIGYYVSIFQKALTYRVTHNHT